jgi:HEAT repeat protein
MRPAGAAAWLVAWGCAAAPSDPEGELFGAVLDLRARYDAALESLEPGRVAAEGEAVARFARAHFEALLAWLGSSDEDRQEAAAFALGFSRNRRAAAPLAAATRSPALAVRGSAIAALGMLGVPGASLEPFRTILDDAEGRVRHAALFGLRHVPAPEFPAWLVDRVQAKLADDVMDVRSEALLVLAKAGRPASVGAILSRSVRDPKPRVRQNAARALGAIGKPVETVTPPLIELLRDEDPRVVEAAWASLRWLHGVDLDRSYEAWRAWHNP